MMNLFDFLKSNNIEPDILQIPCMFFSSIDLEILQKLKQRNVKIILHSPFRLQPNIFLIYKKLEDQEFLPSLESIVGIKIKKPEDLYQIILSYFCVFYYPYSIITSMFNIKHITENNKIVNCLIFDQKKAHELHSFFLKI